MKKKYKCRLSGTSLLVNLKGNVIRLEFEADVVSEYGLRGCSYSTDNELIQRGIEHSARFNSHQKDEVWTDDVEEKEEVAVKGNVLIFPEKEIPAGMTGDEFVDKYAKGTLPKEVVAKGKVVRRGRTKKED